ncbi:methyl-accepting chemotaxis protein [Pseudomonas sp. PB3P13]
MHISIKNKIIVLAGLCLLTIVLVLLTSSFSQSKKSIEFVKDKTSKLLEEAAVDTMKAYSENQALRIQSYFSRTYLSGSGLVSSIEDIKITHSQLSSSSEQLRTTLNDKVKNSIQNNPFLLALYVVYERNSLDGEDSRFLNRSDIASTDSGRFASYWTNRNGQVSTFAVTEEILANSSPMQDGTPFNSWYTCPSTTSKPCILNPYLDELNGSKNLITSITFPIIKDGKTEAVFGLDIGLQTLQEFADAGIKTLFDGRAKISIISSGGLIAACSGCETMLAKPINEAFSADAEGIKTAFDSDKPVTFKTNDTLRIVKRFSPIPDAKPWLVMIEVPASLLFESSRTLESELDKQAEIARLDNLYLGIAAALVGLLLLWVAAHRAFKPLAMVSKMLKSIATGDGDLTQRLTHRSRDELGELTSWFNLFLDKLQPVISQVKATTSKTRDTAHRSSEIAASTSSGMDDQYREIDQVATASQEMSATAHDVAKNAARAAQAAGDAEAAASHGLHVIDTTAACITTLAREMTDAMTDVQALADRSEQIGSVLEVIRSIADQTNLLALNAAIEAARAGEAGRGFAVVADEVRHLARKTQESVTQIRGVIENLQAGTRDVVGSMSQSHDQVHAVAEHASTALEALTKIGDAVRVINDMNLQIATAAEQQSAVAEEVSRNVSNVKVVTEILTAQAGESAKVSQALNALADEQQSLMAGFKA